MKVLTKKAIKDITRRKLRTTLTILSIAIGVMGLSAINLASAQLHSSLAYSVDASGEPDIQFVTAPADALVVAMLQQQRNVQVAQAETAVPARWAIKSGHEPLTIIGLADFHHVQFNRFQLVSGNLPGSAWWPGWSSFKAIAISAPPHRWGDSKPSGLFRASPQWWLGAGSGCPR